MFEGIGIYVLFGVGAVIILAKVPGVWDLVKSIAGSFKKIFEIIFVSMVDWTIYIVKLVIKSHSIFIKNLIYKRDIILPKEKYEEVNRRGGG